MSPPAQPTRAFPAQQIHNLYHPITTPSSSSLKPANSRATWSCCVQSQNDAAVAAGPWRCVATTTLCPFTPCCCQLRAEPPSSSHQAGLGLNKAKPQLCPDPPGWLARGRLGSLLLQPWCLPHSSPAHSFLLSVLCNPHPVATRREEEDGVRWRQGAVS